MPASSAWQRSLQAAESAGRLLDELGVEQSRQVDVFAMCEALGLWLTFLPMEGLLGAFVPQGAGGVLITDRRPITVQRYTAAHEIGHWRLEHGHGFALDGEEHVFGETRLERERLAQVFAASLLMPPPLIFELLNRIGAGSRGSVGPREAYYVAREAGVSYEAAVRQLGNLQVVTRADTKALLSVRPLAVKSEIAGGRRPDYGYADVWPVDENWNQQHLSLRADDEVVVSLPENRSTGYRWMFDEEVRDVSSSGEPPATGAEHVGGGTPEEMRRALAAARTTRPGKPPAAALSRVRQLERSEGTAPGPQRILQSGVTIVGDAYIPGGLTRPLQGREARRLRLSLASGERPSSDAGRLYDTGTVNQEGSIQPDVNVMIGATGRRLLGVRFVDPGPKTLRLQHRSPYSDAPAVEEYVLHAMVEPHRHGFSIDQLVPDPQEVWVGQVRERRMAEPTDRFPDPEQG